MRPAADHSMLLAGVCSGVAATWSPSLTATRRAGTASGPQCRAEEVHDASLVFGRAGGDSVAVRVLADLLRLLRAAGLAPATLLVAGLVARGETASTIDRLRSRSACTGLGA